MISLNIKTDDGEKRIQVPTSWDELTWEQYTKVDEAWDRVDPIMIFSIITGLEFESLNDSESHENEELVYKLTQWAYDPPNWKGLKPPPVLLIGDKAVKIPQDIGAKSLGQKVMLNQSIMEQKETRDMMTDALCIYLQPLYDNKFDRTRFDRVKQLLMKANALQCYAIASFFLTNPTTLIRLGQLGWKQLKMPETKQLQG